MAGNENYMNAERQCNIIRKALPNHKILLYKKNEFKKLLKECKNDTLSIVILFSAGCKNTYDLVKSKFKNVWVVEPHYSYVSNIKEAIKIGLPKNHVILGPKKARGMGIISGCRSTPINLNHFQSLTWVCKIIDKI